MRLRCRAVPRRRPARPTRTGRSSCRPGSPCPCGARGCLQAYAGLPAVLGDHPAPAGTTPEAAIAERADAGDVATLAALDSAGTVLLGGSLSLLSSWLTAGPRSPCARRCSGRTAP
ncbi:hypothetical protein ACPPVO_20885 [Dactylosporangium sp. McL0621]|uniref:hypothetical protein n=1 Tax=Dactylosporangium sp. McL0621 TaxID=3415678 RepID=UPI003CF1ABE9